MKTREQIITGLRELRDECQDTLTMADSWNENYRKPGEPPVVADPDGQLGRIIECLDAFFAQDTGEGLIKLDLMSAIGRENPFRRGHTETQDGITHHPECNIGKGAKERAIKHFREHSAKASEGTA